MKPPKVNYSLLRNFFVGILLSSVVFVLGYYFGVKGYQFQVATYPKVTIDRQAPPEKKEIEFNLFWRVWDTVHQSYFDKSKIKDSDLVYGAIRGMVAAIGDPYTVYLAPEENKVIQEDLGGSFEGVGIQIGFKGNQLAVVAPLPGSPADKAGIKAGDFIVGIKDEGKKIERGTIGITLPEAVQLIRGAKGTRVTLFLLREKSETPLEIEVTRESIDVPSITITYIEKDGGQIAHLKLTKFAAETLGEWEDTVSEFLVKKDLKGIVIDVRNNPGGYLDDAIEIASDFLETGKVIVKQQRSDGNKEEHKVQKLGRLKAIPVVVLINGGSASASEILAGALRDNNRAKLVGEKSFGKGTVQESMQLEGDGGLHVTVSRWLTPNDTWVNEGSLKPEYEILDSEDTEEDEQLQKAMEVVTGR